VLGTRKATGKQSWEWGNYKQTSCPPNKSLSYVVACIELLSAIRQQILPVKNELAMSPQGFSKLPFFVVVLGSQLLLRVASSIIWSIND
jgi:hypothetical protein